MEEDGDEEKEEDDDDDDDEEDDEDGGDRGDEHGYDRGNDNEDRRDTSLNSELSPVLHRFTTSQTNTNRNLIGGKWLIRRSERSENSHAALLSALSLPSFFFFLSFFLASSLPYSSLTASFLRCRFAVKRLLPVHNNNNIIRQSRGD